MLKVAAAAALSLGSIACAQSIAQTCPENNSLCYSLNIPAATTSSNNGPIYFQMMAPTAMQWVGLGQGTRMAGANIFVMYSSADGNVTVSPRKGVGNFEPEHDTTAQVTLLAGSGVSNGMMTANVRCDNCESWSGGTMDFSGSSGSWIYAYKSGSALNSNSLTQEITYHDNHGTFTWDFTQAQGGSSANPFTTAAATNPSSNNNNTSSSTTTTSTAPFGGDNAKATRIIAAHGTVAALAFVAFFPTGGILIRLASFSGVVWVHAAIQALANLTYIAGFGLGIYVAMQTQQMSAYHPIIGIVLFVLMIVQPLSGWMHHKLFAKSGGRRTAWSWEHIVVGRVGILLGMVNGGLGIMLAGDVAMKYTIAYGVCAAVMGLAYVASIVVGEMKRRKRGSVTGFEQEGGQKRSLGSEDMQMEERH